MKKLLVLVFALSLCIMLAACGGSKTPSNGSETTDTKVNDSIGGQNNTPETTDNTTATTDNIIQTDKFSMLCLDGWTTTKKTEKRIILEKDTAYFDVEISSLGIPPAAENVELLSYEIAGYTWKGFVSEPDGGLHAIQAKFSGSDNWCVIHTRGITPDDPEIVEMIESITLK